MARGIANHNCAKTTQWFASHNLSFLTIWTLCSVLLTTTAYVPGCQPNQVKCFDGVECIAASARCDGKFFDCKDGSDEADCPTSPIPIMETTTVPPTRATSERFTIISDGGTTKIVPITSAGGEFGLLVFLYVDVHERLLLLY